MTDEMMCLVSLYFSDSNFKYENKINLFSNFDKEDKLIIKNLLIDKTKNKYPIVKIEDNFEEGLICYSKKDCIKINFETIKNVLGGDFSIQTNDGHLIFPYLYLGTNTNKLNIFDVENRNSNNKFEIYIKKILLNI